MNGGTRALRHKVLLTINRPLIQGETITLKPQTGGETLTAQVSDTMLSAVISVPHHGWTTNSLDKKAFIGGWYGVPITGFSANTQWGIVDATTGKFVSGWGYTNNKPSLRVHRSANQLFTYSSSINNFTLRHDYWEADFSTLTSPGKYQVVVQGYGASVPFEISNNVHLPLVRHTMRGLMHLAHGYEYRAQSGLLGYTQPTFKYVAKVVSGATAASWSPDGIGNQGKIWEGPRGATLTEPGGATMVVREDDSVLKNFLPDDIVEGYRDAADYDIRPQHLMMLVDMTTVAMAYPWLSQQDFGRAEPAVYNKVVRGTRISGSRALSDFDQSILHGVDAWARMQLISKAGSWVPTAMPSNLGNWAGAVRGGFEMGAYLGCDTNFMSWARNPKQPNNQYVLYFLRPDPWSTYAAAAAFGATALRMKQIGDPVLEEYYRDRAVAAWNWAIDNEDRNYTYNGRVAWSTSWRSDREFQESKATAAVALWLLTGTQSYHQVYTSVTNHDDMTGVDRTVAARLYYIASKNPALGSGRSFSDSVLTQIERDAKSTLSTLSQRLNSSATSLFYRPEGYGFSNPNFQNSPPSPRYAELVYHPLMMMYDALSVTEKQQLRRMLDAEVSQMAGRNPDNRPYVTGFGYDPTRDVMIGDWGGTGLRVVPPGLVALELLSNEKISSSDTDGYTVNGVENPAAIPFLHRRVMGRGVASTIGEFQVDTSIWPSILAPIVAHELGRQN